MTKWSDGRNGQKKGQGWSAEGYEEMNKEVNKVKKFRNTDKNKGWIVHRRALALAKTKAGVELAEKVSSKKRKRDKKDEAPVVHQQMEDLSDDDYEDDVELDVTNLAEV